MNYSFENDKTVKKYKLKSNLILIWDKFIKIVPMPFLVFIIFYIVAGLTGHLVYEDGTVVPVSDISGPVISLLLFVLPVYHICRFIYWRTDRGLGSKLKHQQKSINRLEKATMYTQMALNYMENTVISKEIEDGNPTFVIGFMNGLIRNRRFNMSDIDSHLFSSEYTSTIITSMVESGLISSKSEDGYYDVIISDYAWDNLKNNPNFINQIQNNKYALADVIKNNIYNLNFDTMTGEQFEYFCAEILKKNGFLNVEVTQTSGDYGIDILAEKDYVTYAIQCKCYSSNIGNHAVQEAFSGKEMYKRMVGVVMTNQYFTPAAKKTAEDTRVLLWDRDVLIKMMGTANLNIESSNTNI